MRGAISTQKRLRCERVASAEELAGLDTMAMAPTPGWFDTEEGLDVLEDSLIGNDVLLEECKRQSDDLRHVFSKCMGKDK